MKFLWGFMVLLILGLQYRLWMGEGSFSEVWRLQEAVAEQRAENGVLAKRNKRLDAEVLDLKSGFQAIEERARLELGMIRQHETFFLIVDRHSP